MVLCPAQSEDIKFQRLEAEEILADNRFVFQVEQDINGFMWFGDVKYDGRTAKRYVGFYHYIMKMSKLLEENWGQEVDSLSYYDPKRDSFINNWPQRMHFLDAPFTICKNWLNSFCWCSNYSRIGRA